ncbi:AI-2E family transporter [Flavimarina sp. Hel_I_48]|uniref:AI-2E family transporter n=1 Tax=Flavimarina sp. Hel_I_48 TaxID=1392488 RepID=UPI0004DFB932|nr:AI-2E family transporter [Flavimarina sp. Hel_I_48]
MQTRKIEVSSINLLKTLVLLSLIWVIFYYGATLLLPLLVSAMVATLLDRPKKKLMSWGFPNWLAITVCLLLLIITILLLSWLISSQISNMANDWSTIKTRGMEKYTLFSSWMEDTFGINPGKMADENFDFMNKLKSAATVFISSLSNLLSQSFIILVYIILFLMQKKMFIGFFQKLGSDAYASGTILKESSQIITDYLFGKSKIMFFLFVIYYVGFLIGKVPYALFLALFASLFSIIPYVGNLIGGGVAIVLAYLYEGTTPALIVIGVISAAQLIENYILTPWIIGDEIDLNPFITVFGVIVLSVLGGIVGAIIALPVLGVLKVFFEHTKGMEAYAFLLKKHSD